MRPLGLIAAGLALVVLDFRTESIDFLLDPLGWALVAVGARRMWLPLASWLAWLAAVLSLSDVTLPYTYVRIGELTGKPFDPQTPVPQTYQEHHMFDPVRGWLLAAMLLAMTVAGVTLWVLLRELARRATAWGRDSAARQLRLLRWLTFAVWVLPYLALAGAGLLGEDGSFEPIWKNGLEFVALAGLAAMTCLFVLLCREANRAWAMPGGASGADASPWDGLRRPPP